MNQTLAISGRAHRYFSMAANLAIWGVLAVVVMLFFNSHLEEMITNYVNNANVRAGMLAGWVSDIDWSQQGTGINLPDDLSQRMLDNSSLFGGSDSNIVSLRIFLLNQKNYEWENVFNLDRGNSYILSNLEKQAAALIMAPFLDEALVPLNDQGFGVKGVSDFKLGNKNMRLVISLDADKFVWDQTKGVLVLLLILLMIGIILLLRYRLFMIGIRRAFLGEYLEEELVDSSYYKVAMDKKRQETEKFFDSYACSGDDDAVFKVYKDVMYAVSQGKVLLVKDDELRTFTESGEHLLDMRLQNPGDVPLARDVSRRFISKLFPYYETVKKALLSVSEAATNVIKHAGHGEFQLKKLNEDTLRFIFRDEGPGMDLKRLPSMIFYQGFSTTKSLGCGFSLINNIADRMILSTSEKGTTICFDIEFKKK